MERASDFHLNGEETPPGRTHVGVDHQTSGKVIFFCALGLSALDAGFQVALPTFLLPLASGVGEILMFTVLLYSLIPFLVSPVLLFLVFYHLGRNIVLAGRYLGVCARLFFGGLVGYSVTYFFLPVALGHGWSYTFPDLVSVVTAVLGIALIFIRAGLDSLFPGFVAIAIANYRRKEQALRALAPSESKA